MSFSTSISGARGAQSEIATISNNLANAQTTGFKRSRVEFGDLFAAGPAQGTRTVSGQGVRVQQVMQTFSQGTLVETGRELDLGVVGEGFFVVRADPGTDRTYTRAGSFQLDANRYVIDAQAARVQMLAVDTAGNVTVPNTLIDFRLPSASPTTPTSSLTSVTISLDGLVKCNFTDGTTQSLGKIALASFSSPEGLRPEGDAHWSETVGSGTAIIGEASTGSFGEIRSSSLEKANVDVTEEMVALMIAQRNFQANAKAIEIQSALSQTIVNLR